MNIKFQDDSIHFIQNLDGSNRLYKYSSKSVELIETLNNEKKMKLTFMTDISNKYQDTYQYLFGSQSDGHEWH